MSGLIGHVASDLTKIGVSSTMGAIAGLMVGTYVSIAAFPIFITIAVSLGAGWALQKMDDRFGLTEKLVATIDRYCQELAQKKEVMEKALGRTLQEAERELVWHSFGVDINDPMGLSRKFR